MPIPSLSKNIAVITEAIRGTNDPIYARTRTAYGVGYIDALVDSGFLDEAAAQPMREDIRVIRNRRLIQLGAPMETTDL